MGVVRRAGLAAADRRRAGRPRLPLRAGLPRPRRLPAPVPADDDAGGPRPAVRGDDGPVRGRRPAGLVHPRARRRSRVRASRSSTAGSRRATGRCRCALFLHAAGFHCLTIDVRGHGANPAEALPLSAGEFGLDAPAAFEALLARPEVTVGAVVGHSMGAIGAILAAAADPRVAAVVATSAPGRSVPAHPPDVPARPPADPRPDRLSAGLAHDPGLPRPRGHMVAEISATRRSPGIAGRSCSPTATRTRSCPFGHMARLAAAARAGAADGSDAARCETLVDRRRPALVAVRGRGLSRGGRPVPRGGAGRPAGPRRGGRDRRGHARPSGSRPPRPLLGGRRDAGRLPDAGPGRAARRDAGAAPESPRPRARRPAGGRRARPRLSDATRRRLARGPSRRVDPPVRRPAARAAHLERILQAGRRANSSKNQQRWAFIVCRDRAHLRELAAVGPYAGHLAGAAVGDRARDARSADDGRAAVGHVRSRPGRRTR